MHAYEGLSLAISKGSSRFSITELRFISLQANNNMARRHVPFTQSTMFPDLLARIYCIYYFKCKVLYSELLQQLLFNDDGFVCLSPLACPVSLKDTVCHNRKARYSQNAISPGL